MKPTTTTETAFLAYLKQIGAEREDSLRVFRQFLADMRSKPNLTVLPDAPEVLVRYGEIMSALGMKPSEYETLTAYLKAPFDPLPARWTVRGIQVTRSRLELWCQRFGHYDTPRPGLPTLHTREDMAKAIGVSVPNLKLYMQGKDGRIRPPITQGRPSWCYVDALKDWATSLSISYALKANYSERSGSLAALEDEQESEAA